MDGVFDLFHRGHLEAIKKVRKEAGEKGTVIIGIVSDIDASSYKRLPIINEKDRIEIVSNIKDVDEIVFPCPMFVSTDFLDKNNIDMVVHGFADKNDYNNQKDYFKEIISLGKLKVQEYYKGTSTSEIIKIIKKLN